LTEYYLLTLVDFGEHLVFEDVSRQYLIYVISKKEKAQQHTELSKYANDTFIRTGQIGQAVFLDSSNYSFRADLQKADVEVKYKLERVGAPLGALCCVNPGIVAHSRANSPISFKKNDVIGFQRLDENYKRYVEGEDVARWTVRWKGLYIDYESKRQYFHRPKFPELFESPKIMIRGVSGADNSIVSVYDPDGYYTNHSLIHAVKWTPKIQELQHPVGYEIDPDSGEYDLQYIAGLVNSTVVNYYFSKFLATGALQGSYSDVYPEDMRKFPIRRIAFTTPAEERARLAEKGRKLYAQFCEKEDYDCVLGFVEHQLIQQPERADVVHDLLAYLAEQMIAMHRAAHEETRGFLAWLEREAGAALEELTGRTRVQNYLGDYQKGESPLAVDELLDILRQNRRRLRADPSARAFQTRLAGEYAASLERLLPLKARLAASDRLIDRVVYRLYGLTEQEIGLVEGGPGE
jgi:hypothetical protein